MKRLLVICTLLAASLIATMPAEARTYSVGEVQNVQTRNRNEYVTNPDGILSSEAEHTINALCASLRERGIAEVAVVALDNIEGGDAFSFAVELFEGWGVGDQKLSNGLGILLVKDLREVRFVTGYGLEGAMPDAVCHRIQQNYMVPHFREGDYSEGMLAGVEAIEQLLSGAEIDLADHDAEEEQWAWISLAIVMGLIVVPLFIVLREEYRKTKCPTCGKHKLRVVHTEIIERSAASTVTHQTLVCDNCHTTHTRTIRRDNDSQGGRRGGGGIWIFPMGGMGGFGGGGSFGGGFGGGSFGGGGAGSRW